MLENSLKIIDMEMEKWFIQMVFSTRENGKKMIETDMGF